MPDETQGSPASGLNMVTFHSEHDQYAGLPDRIDLTLIGPLARVREALRLNVSVLSKTVNQHAELAKMLYDDSFGPGEITFASQKFLIEKTQVRELAEARLIELGERLDKQLTTMANFKMNIEALESDIKEVLKGITINGKPVT